MIPPEARAKIEADLDHFEKATKGWRPCCPRFYRADGDRLFLDEDAVEEYYERQEDPEEFRVQSNPEGLLRRRSP